MSMKMNINYFISLFKAKFYRIQWNQQKHLERQHVQGRENSGYMKQSTLHGERSLWLLYILDRFIKQGKPHHLHLQGSPEEEFK